MRCPMRWRTTHAQRARVRTDGTAVGREARESLWR